MQCGKLVYIILYEKTFRVGKYIFSFETFLININITSLSQLICCQLC